MLSILIRSTNIGIAIFQDAFLTQPVKVIVLYVITLEVNRPQLLSIRRAIYSIVMDLANKRDREARGDSLRVIQHVVASCRAARMVACKNLLAARILRNMDDFDAFLCRDNRKVKMGILMIVVVAMPTLILLTQDHFAELFVDSLIAGFVTSFLIANSYLLRLGPVVFIVVYVAIACFCYFHGYLLSTFNNKRAWKRRNLSSYDGLPSNTFSRERQQPKRAGNAWYQRMWRRAGDQVASLLVTISSPLGSPHMSERSQRLALNWRNMNRDRYYPEVQTAAASKDDEDGNRSRAINVELTGYSGSTYIPEQILKMGPSAPFLFGVQHHITSPRV